ncbi:hypothetical protein RKD05_001583 [Microbacterium sp. SLBN-111]
MPPEELRQRAGCGLGEAELLEELRRLAAGVGPRKPEQAREDDEVLGGRELLVDRRELPREADELPDDVGVLDDVVAEDLGPSPVGTQQRREHADGGGLSGTVGAENAVDGPGFDDEIDAVDGPVRAERLDEPFGSHRGNAGG